MIVGAFRNVFAVKVFEQRDCVFARYGGPILKFRYTEFLATLAGEQIAKVCQCCCGQHQFIRNSYQLTFAEQDLQNRFGARRFDAGRLQDLMHGRRGKARGFECGFNGCARLHFIDLQNHAMALQPHDFAILNNFGRCADKVVEDRGGRAFECAAFEVLLRNAGQQRLLFVELANGGGEIEP